MKGLLQKVGGGARILCEVLFAFTFLLICANVLFNRAVYEHVTLLLLLWGALSVAVLAGVFLLGRKFEQRISSLTLPITLISALLLFILQICIAPALRFTPQFDLEAVFSGAVAWVENGTFTEYSSSTCYKDYFYIFPNNLGTLSFYALFFKAASLLGISDFFAVATVINAALICSCATVSARIADRLFGAGGALATLAAFFLMPPFYFMAPAFYTDSLSLLFPVCFLLFCLKADAAQKPAHKILLVGAAGLFAAVGALIKMTVLIPAVALALTLLFRGKIKDLAVYAAALTLSLCVVLGGFNAFMYSTHLSRDKARQENTPVLYWLNIGSHGNGKYDDGIYQLTRSVRDPKERKSVLLDKLLTDLAAEKPKDIYKRLEQKTTVVFGDGTLGLSDFLDDGPSEHSPLHDFLLYDGEDYPRYSTLCTGVFAALLLMALVSLRKRKLFTLRLSLFGAAFFFLFWEVSGRYITTFVPIIILLAVGGIEVLCDKIKSIHP